MRWLFWFLLIAALAAGLSLLASINHGYIMMVRPPYRVEFSLNFLIVAVLLLFVLFHLILQLIHYTQRLPSDVRAYKQAKRLQAAHAKLIEALQKESEGDYQQAENAAKQAFELGEDANITLMIAARSAIGLRATERCNYYLAEHERLAPYAGLARDLLKSTFKLSPP